MRGKLAEGWKRRLSRARACALLRALLLPGLAVALFCREASGFDLRLEPATPAYRPNELWLFLPIGYLFTVAIETPVLLLGLTRELSFRARLFAGFWLTACTYPIVVLVLPVLFGGSSRGLYLLVAEVFAPAAECALFWLAFRGALKGGPGGSLRNFAVIALANVLSFLCGEALNAVRWFGLF